MFNVTIIDSVDILYEDLADGVYFNVENIGQVGVLSHHIDKEFRVFPSCIYVFRKKEKFKFFTGCGFAKMHKNTFILTSLPVSISFEKFTDRCKNLQEYGQFCQKNFINITL